MEGEEERQVEEEVAKKVAGRVDMQVEEEVEREVEVEADGGEGREAGGGDKRVEGEACVGRQVCGAGVVIRVISMVR